MSASDSAGDSRRAVLEVVAVDGEQVACARGAHRRRARRDAEQRELAERVTAAELADHGAGGLVDDLQTPGAHDVHRVARVALAKQPVAGVDADRPCARGERLAQRALEIREQRDVREEVGRRLRARGGGLDAIDEDRARERVDLPRRQAFRRTLRADIRAASPSDGGTVSRLQAPDEQAAEAGDDQASGAEGPGVVEGRERFER